MTAPEKRAPLFVFTGIVVLSVVFFFLFDVAERSPLAVAGGRTVLRPEIGDLIRAAYDPVMPVAANDASHALRLAARLA